MKRPEKEKVDVPKLDQEIKKKNGASSRKLHRCIDMLEDIIEGENAQETTGNTCDTDDNELRDDQ